MAELHWIVTLQWPDSGGVRTYTLDGTITPAEGATRKEIYRGAVAHAKECVSAPQGAVVVFFDLAPNQLPAPEGN